MRKRVYKILVTGGAGFIGSEFVRQAVKDGFRVVVVDKLTYAGDLKRLEEAKNKYRFYKKDICRKKDIAHIFAKERPQMVVHFAAETHVDRSIKDSSPFIKTNVLGTQVLLDVCREYKIKRFIHISSDEVYGEIHKGKFSEDSCLCPNSPYACSKAAADLLIKAYIRTYKFPAIIVRASNTYGPWQYPEKLIPLSILKALKNDKIPVYGKGENVREWLYVSDCAKAILFILKKAKLGEIYNVGSSQERKNIDVVLRKLSFLNKPKDLISFVKDRPGHDFRYALDAGKIRKDLGWQAKVNFEEGLKATVDWYKKNKKWLFSKDKR